MTATDLKTYTEEITRQARVAAKWWATQISCENEVPHLASTIETLIYDEILSDWLLRRSERPSDWEEDVAPIIITSEAVFGIIGGWGFYLSEILRKSAENGTLTAHLVPPQHRIAMNIRYERVEVEHGDEHEILFDINKK